MHNHQIQPGILADLPHAARYLFFTLLPEANIKLAMQCLRSVAVDRSIVIGLGPALVKATGAHVDGLRNFPNAVGPGIDIPSQPFSLWCWLRGDDRGVLLQQTRALQHTLAPAFFLDHVIDAFQYGTGRDLTGYEDGTENPKGDNAVFAGIVNGRGAGLDGSSFVAVQQWVHDLEHFDSLSVQQQDHAIGRRKSDNAELKDAPPSAHVKRTAQESFTPAAFVLRRSMPWAGATRAGLVFVAFGHSFDAFEALLKRMLGAEDGITDALFRFTRPVSGSYYWCPPVENGHLNLSTLNTR
ncbi:MAG: Dyp-type peroxidase [Gammaproteobacteria bacterium]|nr:Dyp-type peroxidase [Gammaproteobacteria bacterium]